MPEDNDTATAPAGIDLDQSVEDMLATVGAARRTRDEKKATASEAHNNRRTEIDTVKNELAKVYNDKKKELDELLAQVNAEYSRVTAEADAEFNRAVYGHESGPQFNQYGERVR